jgi:hypothetical protein
LETWDPTTTIATRRVLGYKEGHRKKQELKAAAAALAVV